jgi:hypothetical protein
LADRAGLGFRPRYVKQPSQQSFIFVLSCDKLTMSFLGTSGCSTANRASNPGVFSSPLSCCCTGHYTRQLRYGQIR